MAIEGVVRVPRPQGVDPVLVYPVTLGHVRRFGLPVAVAALGARALWPGWPWVTLAAAVAAAALSALRPLGVPIDRLARNLLGFLRRRRQPVVPSTARQGLVVHSARGRARYAALIEVHPFEFETQGPEARRAALASLEAFWLGLPCDAQLISMAKPLEGSTSPELSMGADPAWLSGFIGENHLVKRHTFVVLSCLGPATPAGLASATVALEAAASTACQALGVMGDVVRVRDPLALARAPHVLCENRREARFPGRWVRGLVVTGFPDALPVAWLQELLALREAITFSLHVHAKGDAVARRHLLRSKADLDYKIHKAQAFGRDTTEAEQAALDLQEQLERLTAREARFFEATTTFTLEAQSREGLDRLTREVEGQLRKLGLQTLVEPYAQGEALECARPMGDNPLFRYAHTMDTAALAASHPFLTGTLEHPAGVLVGFHHSTGVPLALDGWQVVPHNRIVVGMSGSGKSYSVKLELLRIRRRRPEAILMVVDPLREFAPTVKALGGQCIQVGDAKNILNPFAFAPGPNALERKLEFLDGLFHILLGALSPYEGAVLMIVVRELYAEAGVTAHPETHGRTPPTMGALLGRLEATRGEIRFREAAAGLAVLLRARMGGVLASLDGQTNVAIDSPIVSFDLHDMDRAWHRLFMFLVLDFLEARLSSCPDVPKQLYIDEAWKLLDEEASARALNHLGRHLRHYRAGVTLLSQTPESFLKSENGRALLQNCQQVFWFRQQGVPADVREAFGLDLEDAQAVMALDAGQGEDHSQCLMVVGRSKWFVQVYSSPGEHAIATSPGEREDNDASRREGGGPQAGSGRAAGTRRSGQGPGLRATPFATRI
ncbi:MAG: VirB4 family type IV secretion system protein [Thermoplasmatota archaeon]